MAKYGYKPRVNPVHITIKAITCFIFPVAVKKFVKNVDIDAIAALTKNKLKLGKPTSHFEYFGKI